jgi:hypothetical protein
MRRSFLSISSFRRNGHVFVAPGSGNLAKGRDKRTFCLELPLFAAATKYEPGSRVLYKTDLSIGYASLFS